MRNFINEMFCANAMIFSTTRGAPDTEVRVAFHKIHSSMKLIHFTCSIA
jgi:hypothetical protein